MAKLYQNPIVCLAIGLLLIAQANARGSHSSAAAASASSEGSEDSAAAAVSASGDSAAEASIEGPVCTCGDNHMREVFHKFMILFRAYTSKELGPDVQAMGMKIANFVLNYLVKEKPDQMEQFHSFLQNSAEFTGKAVAKVGKSKRAVKSAAGRWY